MVAEDPLGEVKKAVVAIGRLPEEVPGPGAEQYFDGALVDFEVGGTGFIYVHTPLEFAESRSEPDPETGAVYYWAMIWIVTCKHCVPESGVTAVRVNTTDGSTRIYAIGAERWTRHPTEDVAITPLPIGVGHESHEEVEAAIQSVEFEKIDDKKTAQKPQILRMGFFESTPVSIVGFPIGMLEGGKKNYPVVRSGSIAQIQGYLDGDPEHAGFLIDGSGFGGNSGGPAVVRKSTLNSDGRVLSETVLIGLVSGSSYTHALLEDESRSDVMENADLVHVVAVEDIHATVRQYHSSRMAERR